MGRGHGAELPVQRVLQFGTGRFLRGFVDAFIDDTNAAGGGPRRTVTVVETTGSGTAARLAAQGCRYRLLVRGLERGVVVDTSREIAAIDRVVDASDRMDGLLAAAVDPDLRFIVSNTTETGYASGFPGRLAAVLETRARAGLPGVVVLPCELVERNGDRLRELVLAELDVRDVEPAVADRVRESTTWGVTLVDRITTAPGPDVPGTHGDPLAVAVEPFASWVVEVPMGAPIIEGGAVERTHDVGPYALRKIRILNGAHTALVSQTRGGPFTFVREAMADAPTAAWLETLMLDELVPALGDRIVDGAAFAHTVLERFRNPFLDHRLSDIEVHHAQKLVNRLVPTAADFRARFGRAPRLLGQVLEREGVG